MASALASSRCGTVALFVFLPAAARAGIVAPDLRLVATYRLHRRIVAADTRRLLPPAPAAVRRHRLRQGAPRRGQWPGRVPPRVRQPQRRGAAPGAARPAP